MRVSFRTGEYSDAEQLQGLALSASRPDRPSLTIDVLYLIEYIKFFAAAEYFYYLDHPDLFLQANHARWMSTYWALELIPVVWGFEPRLQPWFSDARVGS